MIDDVYFYLLIKKKYHKDKLFHKNIFLFITLEFLKYKKIKKIDFYKKLCSI